MADLPRRVFFDLDNSCIQMADYICIDEIEDEIFQKVEDLFNKKNNIT